ncbi:MAG: hypothetical protein K8F90_00970 [Hyphomicrobiales bacterium]|nr:hypothetical protein [Hyphomicrobiales bacterium]
MSWKSEFDWAGAIARKSEALRGIIEVLFALLGLDGSDAASRIPKSLHSAVLGVLRPAESAVRRLIVIAARGLVVKLAPSRPMPKGHTITKGSGNRLPAFRLADTRKNMPELREPRVRYSKYPPRILFLGPDSRIDDLWPRPQPKAAPVPPPDGRVSALRLHRRLQAIKLALDDLPRQARRMARWRQRRDAMPGPKFTSPLRPGPPPGHRKRHIHLVDDILADCHWLAWDAMRTDTS